MSTGSAVYVGRYISAPIPCSASAKRSRLAGRPIRRTAIHPRASATAGSTFAGPTTGSGSDQTARNATSQASYGSVRSVRSSQLASTPPSPLAAWLARFAQLLQYRLMVLFRLPTWGKMLALVAVGLPIILLGSGLLVAVSDLPWGEAAQYAFYVLQNVPGTDITGFGQVSARLVLIVIHLLSLYTFATMVGLLTEDVRVTVEEIRSGNFSIPAEDHTVILDPSDDPARLVNTLKQVLAAREARGTEVYSENIAVLSAHDKDELDKQLVEELGKDAGRVVTRTGSPIKVADLERVAAAHARTILLLAPGGPMGHLSTGLQQQLCLTALRSLHCAGDPSSSGGAGAKPGRGGKRAQGHRRQRRQRVVVESGLSGSGGSTVLQEDHAEDAQDLDPLDVTYVSSTSSASRAAVQCAAQPGLAAVFDAVFCRSDDASLRLVPVGQHLAGRTFAQARRQFRNAVVCGVLAGRRPHAALDSALSGAVADPVGDPSTALQLCPPDHRVLTAGDHLVLMASCLEDCKPLSEPTEALPTPRRVARYDARRSQLRQLVLLAADSQLAAPMLTALAEFAAEGCTVTVVSPEPCHGLPAAASASATSAASSSSSSSSSSTDPLSKLRFRNQVGDLLSPATLLRADAVWADAVILTGTDHLPADESDALAVGAALLLQRLLADPLVASARSSITGGSRRSGSGDANGGTDSPGSSSSSLSSSAAASGALSSQPDSPSSSALQSRAGDDTDEAFWTGAASLSSVASLSSIDMAGEQQRPQDLLLGEKWPDQGPMPAGRRPLAASTDAAAAAAAAASGAAPGQRAGRRRLTYVCSLHDPQNRSVLEHIAVAAGRAAEAPGGDAVAGSRRGLTVEVVDPGTLISGMLAQAGAAPLVVSVLEDLLDEQGCEMYLKRMDRYGLPAGERLSWAQVSEVVREPRSDANVPDIALGYLTRAGRLHLAPSADMQMVLQAGDKLVVLSESFL